MDNIHAITDDAARVGVTTMREAATGAIMGEKEITLLRALSTLGRLTTEYNGLAVTALRRAGQDIDDAVLAHIWPAHHENVEQAGHRGRPHPRPHRPCRPRDRPCPAGGRGAGSRGRRSRV